MNLVSNFAQFAGSMCVCYS